MGRLRVAIRSTRTPTSAPSTRASSSRASRSSWRPVRRRARPAQRLVWACPSAAGGSRRRSSRRSRPLTGSRSRRSSARSCRCSPSAPRPRRSRRPTTPPTASPRASGPTRARRRSRSRARCRPASSGRTPTTTSTRRPPSGATRRAVRARGRPAGLRPYTDIMSRLAAEDLQAVRRRCLRALRVGRYDRVQDRNVPRGSRKDVRDAVRAARAAARPWAARTAYNRGQILYRAAEALESRGGELGVAGPELEASIDVLVHYAGWTDKFQPVLGGINPVAAPFLSFSLPEPTGVVGIVAPEEPELLGLVAELAPALAAGNTVVAVPPEPSARGARPRRGARRVRRAGRRRQPAVGTAGRAGAGAGVAPRPQRGRGRLRRSRARRESTGWPRTPSRACGDGRDDEL